MQTLRLLDLENRKGKAPGGYQSTLAEARVPFIFMNAVGLQRDVETILHEAGHAFHALATELNLTTLIEVHSIENLMRVRDNVIGFPHKAYSLLGINNRDLQTFKVDVGNTLRAVVTASNAAGSASAPTSVTGLIAGLL